VPERLRNLPGTQANAPPTKRRGGGSIARSYFVLAAVYAAVMLSSALLNALLTFLEHLYTLVALASGLLAALFAIYLAKLSKQADQIEAASARPGAIDLLPRPKRVLIIAGTVTVFVLLLVIAGVPVWAVVAAFVLAMVLLGVIEKWTHEGTRR